MTRRLPDGTSEPLDSVTTGKDSGFTFTDTPPDVGDVTYTVLWDGDSRSRWSSASVTVTVRRISALTLDGPVSGTVGEPMELTGVLTAPAGHPHRAPRSPCSAPRGTTTAPRRSSSRP